MPDHTALIYDLHLQLRMHGWADRLLKDLEAEAPVRQVRRLLVSYHNAALRWCERHGYRGRRLFHGQAIERIPEAWKEYLKKQDVKQTVMEEVITALEKEGHDQSLIVESLGQTPIEKEIRR